MPIICFLAILSASWKICIDPGHGGTQPGASYFGKNEKDDTLRFSRQVVSYLQAAQQDVIMTRNSDVTVELLDRAKIANDANADVFVSIHRNAYNDSSVVGLETYYWTPENSSELLAKSIYDRLLDIGVSKARGVKSGNLSVLRNTYMPSTLVEMLFIDKETDNYLYDHNFDKYCRAVCRGILDYLNSAK